MDIAWFRDLSVTILGFAATVTFIVGVIVLLRLYSSLQAVIKEVRMTSMLAHDAAERVHEGMRPILALFEMIQDAHESRRRRWRR
jgi:hypothetical protein